MVNPEDLIYFLDIEDQMWRGTGLHFSNVSPDLMVECVEYFVQEHRDWLDDYVPMHISNQAEWFLEVFNPKREETLYMVTRTVFWESIRKQIWEDLLDAEERSIAFG
jgi:hypothetical protein